MTALDRVIEMQQQGMPDEEVAKRLRDEGVSVREINDALNQSKIKQAVSQQEQPDMYPGMEQSIMQAPEAQEYAPPQQEYYAPQETQYQEYQQYAPALDTETITEIANQVVSEKFSEFRQKTGDLISFRNEVQEKLKDLNERIKRIEDNLDNIQRAILGKVGEFGNNMNYIRKDLENLHNTVSGLMNPLIDNYRELKKMAK